jgi:carbamoyltransferase
MNILGISAFYHDSAACLIMDGKIVSAAQEERFTRKKHDHNFPIQAIDYCLHEAGIDQQDLDLVAFYDKPFQKFDRLLSTYLTYAPRGFASFLKAMPLWLNQKLWIKDFIAEELKFKGKILFPEHHQSHAASAFFPSPFQDAAFLTVDGVGEWATSSYGIGENNKINIMGELHFPHSLGLLYSAFTYFTGFRVNSGEYKLMGLAPYGNPEYVDIIKNNLIDLKADGSFKLNMQYFNFAAGLTMTNKKFSRLFGGPPRKPETLISQREMDIARSIQEVSEEILLKMVHHVQEQTSKSNLVLAGGVALNCVGNGRILREGPFQNIWIQPAAGDAGGALGAALFTWHQYLDRPRALQSQRDSQAGSYLGPAFSDTEIREFLDSQHIPYHRLEDPQLFKRVAQLLADEKVIGWFQGRMEFGPRALGNRSIIGDARSPEMQSTMNLKIKYRESFRPFAPSVLAEKVSDIFDLEQESPYMLLVAQVKEELWLDGDKDQSGLAMINSQRSTVPAITHVDQSARIQTVNPKDNPRYHALINAFYQLTGSPVIINTSFNVRGEPIVCTPSEAFTCFLRTDMDHLVLGNYLLNKSEQEALTSDVDWKKQYELD